MTRKGSSRVPKKWQVSQANKVGADLELRIGNMLKEIRVKTDKRRSKLEKEQPGCRLKKKARKIGRDKMELSDIKTKPSIEEKGNLSQPIPDFEYFKPKEEAEGQPIIGYSKCTICRSYYPDIKGMRNHHP